MYTDADRLILANQFKILASLAPEKKDYWSRCEEIIVQGYEYLYDSLPHLSPSLPTDDGQFVADVLQLFRVLNHYKQAHPDDKEVHEHSWSEFRGFDGNHDKESYYL